MDVNSMWACLQDHDTTNHWKQVAGWRKVCDLAQTHLARLQEYRRGLAEAWPPATNAAARTYIAELDALIEKVRLTHDAAATNYTTLAAATQAISGTRDAIEKIHEEYAAKLQQKRAYEATAADPKAAMGSRVPDRPVTDADLEQLNVQARGIMYGLSGELQQAQVALQKPPATRPSIQTDNPDVYGGSNPAAPAIPPIIPVPLHEAGRATSGGHRNQARLLPEPISAGKGPVLGSAGPSLLPAPAATNPTSPITGSSNTSTNGMPVPALPSNVSSRSSGAPVRDQPGTTARPPASRGSTPGSTAPSLRPTPPGGVIGGPPGVGIGPTPNAQPRRINPVGGVIGGGGAGTAPTGGAGSRPGGSRRFAAAQGTPPFLTGSSPNVTTSGSRYNPSSRTGEDRSNGSSRHWDPDDPWQIDEGVAPVVRPPDFDNPIDPGPAIGLDR
ncbi:hypothetical protein D7193_07510 [Micromonospora costi]|uniref:PPE domain-containing protein n=1 Tax=Micromonospora costi TaxID=1530042 RepID=A0A3B0AFJ0_9ACTN|nr:hypothetical protein [Micromonospora costi]RKN59180.1 hypothetical protein D7193_07510 [Micromonospora costi]